MRAQCLFCVLSVFILAGAIQAQDAQPWLRDRGTGIPTSMFGTYVESGHLIVYPFLELYRDHNYEYKPSDFGLAPDQDFRGRFRATEKLIFLSYGLSDRWAAEVEASAIDATLDKSPQDPSSLPARIHESGLGDVEGQVRYRWNRESASTPELYSWFEAVLPHDKKKGLIGTPQLETTFGSGVIKGFSFGTMTVSGWLAREDGSFAPGMSIEYLRKLNDRYRVYTGVEANQDQVEWITELQVQLSRHMRLKVNNGLGLTSKATDWAPEVGILFSW